MAEEDHDGNHAMSMKDLQSMIDITVERLVGFRTQCVISHELTQSEIRILEAKLIKLFSRQLVIKNVQRDKFGSISSNLKNLPRLEQWLQVVGLCHNCILNICSKVKSVEALLEKPQCKLKNLLSNCAQKEEEFRRISTALKNLKRYMEILVKDEKGDNSNIDSSLHWDSFDYQCTLPSFPDANLNSSVAPSDCPALNFNGVPSDKTFINNISSVTPPVLSPPLTPIHKIKQEDYVQKSPGSMSDNCRYVASRNLSKYCEEITNNNLDQPISKSRSHDSHLSASNDKCFENETFTFTYSNGEAVRGHRRTRLPTVPGTDSSPSTLYSSPTRSPPFMSIMTSNSGNNSVLTATMDSSPVRLNDLSCATSTALDSTFIDANNLPAVPKSPKTPTSVSRVMAHDIAHRFQKHFNFHKPCDYCCKPIRLNTGLKCKECGYRCHKECESKVPPSCGLPVAFVEEFKKQLTPENNSFPVNSVLLNGIENSPLSTRHIADNLNTSPVMNGFLSNIERRGGSDTASSNSHSSAPSSPALFITNQQIPATASVILNKRQQFDFSADVIGQETHLGSSTMDNIDSNSRTIIEVNYDKIVNREDSEDSQNWDGESTDKVWPRQYSVSMKEWEIPWDELKMGEKLGSGHFGTVYSGYWHGDVAIKVLDMDYLGDEKMLENFKSEVSTFRKTRHDNLVLFMGACMKLPRLAIVTSMVHGITLYKYIHLRRDKFSMGKITIIAQQIAQGMGYLHAKGIIHKDLRTKNIFVEKERVIITDFGLFSVTKLCFKNRTQDGLIIPPGWLYYLAPEIMRNLRVHVKPDDEHLPFSKASDIYAFGTVWYELLCGEWPYMTQDPEAVIWQVGKGMKPSLANLEASQDVKAILMQCWAYVAIRRPDFTSLLKKLDKLPKKKLARSPSHPVHLSRSAESMF